MTPERLRRLPLPESARQTLDDLRTHLRLDLRLWRVEEGRGRIPVYPDDGSVFADGVARARLRMLQPRDGSQLELEVRALDGGDPEAMADLVGITLERTLDFAQEVRFFTFELSERYEEINLLYSISETLGSILRLEEAARNILTEVCDVLGARRGSLWVHDPDGRVLNLVASVGEGGLRDPIPVDDDRALTARVFRDGRPLISSESALKAEAMPGVELDRSDTVLSVPIRYTPPEGRARTVGVINLIGRRHGGRFTASDQKLLSAIASQVGAALENNRLIRQSLARERMAREMELAHNLQMKLLPTVDRLDGVRLAARVEPAEMVGGDFYQVFRLSEGRVGIMVGDVSGHGFPAALIMALTMSAATIYASEFAAPAKVLRHLDDALRDELETTEMYLSLVYVVVDPAAGTLTYSNAGHPHAFVVDGAGDATRLLATDPPVGIAGPDAYGEERRDWNPATDLVLLFTDGLSDILATGGSPDGEALLLETVAANCKRSPAEIVDALFVLARDARPTIPPDDRTAVILAGP